MDCQQVINDYLKWIKDNTVVKTIDDGKVCSISTPFLDRHNDHLEIYLIKNNSSFKITDNGYTIADLKMSGFSISTPKRNSILQTVLNGFGVKMDSNNELFVEATPHNIGQKKHYLIQAILCVNDMFNLAEETVYSLFKEDVELYLRSNEIYFSKDIKISGRSGFDHNIDFLVPPGKHKPEKLIRTINTPKKDSALNSIVVFSDISQIRETKPKNYVIYNDIDREVSTDIIGALDNYGIIHIPWSQKEKCLTEFSLS